MISAISWVPKGVSKVAPEILEAPSKEEIEELIKNGILDASDDFDEEQEMDVEAPEDDEVARAIATAKALNEDKDGAPHDITDGLRELNMDMYDEEDEGLEFFSHGMGDRYYPSNELDPHLQNKDDDDDDEEENEDMTIKPTDAVIVCACSEDEVGRLELWILEELEDGSPNFYVHHDIILSSYPLCIAWLDCNLNGGDRGSFMAVGSMDPSIEIWDLDRVGEVQPFKVLGGVLKKKKKKGKEKFVEGSHSGPVLGLAWNQEVRNVLASGSADHSVKIWDVANGNCVLTLEHHTDKVQAVAWSQHSSTLLLSGSFDKSVVMTDMREEGNTSHKWLVSAEVESLVWDPHSEHRFVASLENGTVQTYDTRMASSNSESTSKPVFTIHAHEKEVTSVSFNQVVPNLLATASVDKTVKLWDVSTNEPSFITSHKPKAGAVFSVSFSKDYPFMLAIGGSKGELRLWDTLSEQAVVNKFGKYSKPKE